MKKAQQNKSHKTYFNMQLKKANCTYQQATEMKKKHILQCRIKVIKTVQYEN